MSSLAGIAASTGMPTASAKACASPVPSSLLMTMPATPTLPPKLAEIFDRRAHVVGDVERLQVVRADDDHLLAHVPRDRQAEAAAHDVAQEVEQHVVEAPIVEAELLEQLEAVDDAAPAAAAADLGPAELHGEHAVADEADVADRDLLAGQPSSWTRSR